MIDPDNMVQAIADGLTIAQAADRFGVSVDEVRDAQKQALAAFQTATHFASTGCWRASAWPPVA